MRRGQAPRPRALDRSTFAKLMEQAVPLDRTGDERIEELLGMLRQESDRAKRQNSPRPAGQSSRPNYPNESAGLRA